MMMMHEEELEKYSCIKFYRIDAKNRLQNLRLQP